VIISKKQNSNFSLLHNKKPILFFGTGQGYVDLEVFDKDKVVGGLGL